MSTLPPLEELQQREEQEPEDLDQPTEGMEAGSLQARLHARRAELESKESQDFEVPGYEGILVARYHLLPWKTHRGISARNDKEKVDGPTRELYTAADTLIHACDGLFEHAADGNHRPLELKWGVRAATEFFGIDGTETARQAVLACFPRDTLLVAHYGAVMQWQQGARPEVDEGIEGEFEAGPAST